MLSSHTTMCRIFDQGSYRKSQGHTLRSTLISLPVCKLVTVAWVMKYTGTIIIVPDRQTMCYAIDPGSYLKGQGHT